MKITAFLSYLLFFLYSSLVISQGDKHYANKWETFSSTLFFQEDMVRDSLINWQEEVLLHLSDTQPEEKQTLFFKSYLRIGKDKIRSSASKVLIVDLVNDNNQLVKRQFHQILDGMSTGQLQLPKNIKKGVYYVKAYTRWMRNYGEQFYAKERIHVGGTSNETNSPTKKELVVYPEGGNFIVGLKNHILFKGSVDGEGATGSLGHIVDEEHQVVSTINIIKDDMGSTIFEPEKGKTYYVQRANGEKYTLPKPLDQGFLLQVNNLDPSIAKVKVTASTGLAGKTVMLKGVQKGIVYFEQELVFSQSAIVNLDLQKKAIPSGVLMLRLFDEAEEEVAVRPIWIDAEQLNITVDQIQDESESKVFQLKVLDSRNQPVQTELAVSVDGSHIDNDFGSPKYGSFQATRNRRYVKDIDLVLSKGVIDKKGEKEKIPSTIQFPIQKGLELYGYAYDLDNKLLKNTTIQILANSENEPWITELETNANGQLRLENLQFYGKADMVFRTKGADTKSRLVKIVPIVEEKQEHSKSLSKFKKKQGKKRLFEASVWQPVDTTNLIELDEVQVNEELINSERNNSLYNLEPNSTIFQNPKQPMPLVDLVRRIPGILVTDDGFRKSVLHVRSFTSFRSVIPPLWVIDGTIFRGNPIDLITALEIERIEFVIGPEAAIFGSRATGGVILIYTKSGSGVNYVPRKEGQLVFQGYEPIIGFDEYESLKNSQKIKKEDAVLYWNPKLRTDENGEVIVKLNRPLSTEKVRIKATTVSRNGKAGAIDVIIDN
ncbi:TonB-dependent receptor [Flagellimonas sp. S3867]|uniref:TonB-dependent receptor n=1 Tax=Flagellimonas sp. S3867 TaxID=2768063 RepID=UPI0016883491|nr:TonB-dependent receptor plug domain-containing protein [Flagellimonas sp. S3867]